MSLLSPEHLPAKDLIKQYHERLDLELSFAEIKTQMLDKYGPNLRFCSPEGVRQEAWGMLVMYNLVRLERLKLAQENAVPARRLSFRGTVLLLGTAWHTAWMTPPGTLYRLLSELERNLKYLLLPERRKRFARREVKRKMSNYPKKQRRHHLK